MRTKMPNRVLSGYSCQKKLFLMLAPVLFFTMRYAIFMNKAFSRVKTLRRDFLAQESPMGGLFLFSRNKERIKDGFLR